MRKATHMVGCAVVILLGCRDAVPDPVEPPSDEVILGLEEMSAPRLLRRTSLDLRGVLPSLEELERVEADPDALLLLQEEILADSRFEERLVQIFAQRWHTTVDEFHGQYYDYFLDSDEEYAFERAVGEEPLRLMARVVAGDRPWSEVVLAEYSMANQLLASIWPMEGYPEEGEGWHEVHYTDGRPNVGVLASNGLWWRYFTTFFNQNRSRAAAISKLLLCEDLLSRPISFSDDTNLLESDDVTGMVLSEPTCQGCHVTIEPLASMLFGFWWIDDYSAPEMDTYHPEREVLGSRELNVEPNYFGKPIAGFGELGYAISSDDRFSRCAVTSMAESLWHRPVGLGDFASLDLTHRRFVDGGMQVKDLILELVRSTEFRSGSTNEEATIEIQEQVRTARILDTSLLRSMAADLSGFVWESEGFDMLDNDDWGYRILGVGVDGEYVGVLQSDPSLTWVLVLRRWAQALSAEVVAHDIIQGARPAVLLEVNPASVPGDTDFETALDSVFFRLMGVRMTTERQAGLEALWLELSAVAGPEAAWQGVLGVLLQDPDFVVY